MNPRPRHTLSPRVTPEDEERDGGFGPALLLKEFVSMCTGLGWCAGIVIGLLVWAAVLSPLVVLFLAFTEIVTGSYGNPSNN